VSLTRRALLQRAAAAAMLAAAGSACTEGATKRSMAPVTPSRAEDLVQHYGINTRFRYDATVYGYTDDVVDLVAELGVRTIRERVGTDPTQSGTQNLRRAIPRLATLHGTRWQATCLVADDIEHDYDAEMGAIIAELVHHYAAVAPGRDLRRLLHSVAGPNEVNEFATYGAAEIPWYDTARILQTTLWNQARVDNALWAQWTSAYGNAVPVAGPSTQTLTTQAEMEQLGDLTDICDRANAHLYQRGVSPARSLDEALDLVSICYDDLPCLVTEAGYNNSLATNAARTVPEWASSIYGPQAPCDFFTRGAAYFRYELLDDPDPVDYASQETVNATVDNSAHYGLVAMTAGSPSVPGNPPSTWRKKPEFYTMQRWISLLSDRDPRTFAPYDFTPTDLTYALEAAADVQQLLVQKHDGHHFLLVWRNVDVFDPDPDSRVDLRASVSAVPISLRLADGADVRVFNPATGGTASTAMPVVTAKVAPGGSLSLSLDYDLLVVEIW
jgi:hypothetical protein